MKMKLLRTIQQSFKADNPQLIIINNKTFLSLGLALFWSVIFFVITRQVLAKETMTLDLAISQYIYNLRTPYFDQFWRIITDFGGIYLIFLSLIITIYLVTKRHYQQLIWFIIPLFVSLSVNIILKSLIGRSRPTISQIITETDFSFPSGHSSSSLVFWAMLTCLIFGITNNKIIRITSCIMASIIIVGVGLSRVYLGVHYPSDIIGGWIQSLVILSLFWNINHFKQQKNHLFLRK